MTTQEWLIFGLALPATLGAIYCLRRRPEFGAIQKNDDVEEREALEFGSGGSLLSMGGDAHTQAIVESVIGETQTVDENAVTAALGEMGAIAAANAAEEIPDDLDLDGEEPIMDSRFTTTIPDEESTEMVEAYIEDAPESEVLPEEEDDGGLEDDDISWGVWDPEPESVSEPIVETPESAEEHDLPEIPELFREPIVSNDALIEEDPLATPSIPEIPEIVTLDEDKPNVSERLTSMATQAADVTLSATKEVVSATMTGAKEVASMAVGIKEKVVQKVRKQSTTAVMPVRPPELPSMAEWDPEKGAWTLMGRTVQIATVPEPEVAAPAWTQQEEAVTEVVQTESPMESSPRRKTPFIPELP